MLKPTFLSSCLLCILTLVLFNQAEAQALVNPLDSIRTDSITNFVFEKIRSTETSAVSFTTDKLGQVYLIGEENGVSKFSREGNLLFNYTNNTLGELSYLDASNPFNLLLFYADYLTVITLDRTLNETGYFVLTDLEMSDITGVGISTENNIWVFDNLSYELKKIDSNGNLRLKSNQLSDLFKGNHFPIQIIENNRKVHLVVPGIGVMLFDDFGQYLYTVEIPNVESVQVGEHEFVYLANKELHSFPYLSRQSVLIALPQKIKEDSKLSIQKQQLYILEDGILMVYRFDKKGIN